MSLATVIARYGPRRLAVQAFSLPSQLHVQIASQDLAKRFDTIAEAPPVEELRALLKRFHAAHAGGTLNQFSRRDWARAIWGIWDKSLPLSGLRDFWPALNAFLTTHSRRSYFKNLALAYLRDFDPSDSGALKAAALLREFSTAPSQADWIWSRRQSGLHLFEPDFAPKFVAAFIMSCERPLDMAREEAGFHGVVACGGMESAAFFQALAALRKSLSQGSEPTDTLKRLLDWAEGERELRFSGHRKILADSLLLPWRSAQPSSGLQAIILAFLLRHYGDPRLDLSGWSGVDPASQQVMRRWLTRVSLEQFIRVVTAVADAGHWRYRKAFWMAYYKRDLIDEAWVLLGRQARDLARDAFEDAARYGEIRGGLANHCVLLLRIGNLTIADWSHSGSCRIWRSGNENAPEFYKREPHHNVALQRGANFEKPHHGSDRHTWQDAVADYIRDETGAWVSQQERTP